MRQERDKWDMALSPSLHPYPEYKDSGVPWAGMIPRHWEISRNGRLFTQRNQTGKPELPILEVSIRGGVAVRDLDTGTRKQAVGERERYKWAAKGEIAYNTMRMWQGAVGVAPADGLVSPAYVVVRPRADIDSRYFAYLFRTPACMDEINSESRGIVSDRNRLYWEDFKQISALVPPLSEQRMIADYLDAHAIWTRRAIRAKQRLIDLLNEQKQAISHRAVTRGLDPGVRLKSSGIDWIGSVPEHWNLTRFRTLVHRIDQGVSPQAEARLADDGSWGVLKAGCVNGGVFRESEHKRLPAEFPIDASMSVEVGDVLISRASGSPRLVGSVGRVASLNYKLILSDKTFRPVFKDPEVVDFLVLAMNARYFRLQAEEAISGAEGLASNLPLSSLRDFFLAVPPGNEARWIADALRADLHQTQELMATTQRHVDILNEYRTRLITDLVTGKVDVRGVELPAVDESDLLGDVDTLPSDIEDGAADAEEAGDADE